jgi:hypothetical protein
MQRWPPGSGMKRRRRATLGPQKRGGTERGAGGTTAGGGEGRRGVRPCRRRGGSDEGRGGRRGLGVALGRGARGAGRRRRGVPQLSHGAGAAALRQCGDSGGSELFGSSRE